VGLFFALIQNQYKKTLKNLARIMLFCSHGASTSSTNQTYQTTMKLITNVAMIALTAVAATTALKADTNSVATGKDVKAPVAPAPAATSPFNLTISENYDSRYMFRGVNELPQTGVLSTTLTPIWHITANDTLSVPLWYATAVGKSDVNSAYKELDVPVLYSHAIGNWTLGAGYYLYNYFNVAGYKPGGQGVQNEVGESVSYTYTNSWSTWTPSITYYQELGTPVGYSYGSVFPGSSFLSPSLSGTIPLTFLKADGSITFNPNTQLNFGFRYNANQAGQALTGLNNWQIQLPVTWQITKLVSVTAYYAYSYQGVSLYNTAPSTGWAGASVGLSF